MIEAAHAALDLDGSTDESDILVDAKSLPIAKPSRWPAGPCYIAGAMRRHPEFNFPAFFAAEETLRAEGAEVGLNPARYDVEEMGFDHRGKTGHEDLSLLGFDLRHSLGQDMAFITSTAKWICVLPGWEKSSGASAEVATAKALGLPVIGFATALPIDAVKTMEPGILCSQASAIVGGARRQAYGSAENNFERIGLLWEAWDCVLATVPEGSVKPTVTVAIRNILQKLARIAETPTHTDSWRDIAGYADCGARCAGCDPAK